jgi:hypothetical protein
MKVVLTLLVLAACASPTEPPKFAKQAGAGVPGSINLHVCFLGDSLTASLAGLPACVPAL